MDKPFKVPKSFIDLLDQIFEVERKIENINESNSIHRNINKIKNIFENIFESPTETGIGLIYHNPIGESYSATRLDLEASIAGNSVDNLVVTEVIKPIIRYKEGGSTLVARKGVVVVESKNK